MERKINLNFLFKIFMFIFLIWICHFDNDMSIDNEYLYKKYIANIKIVTRSYRLLGKHKKEKCSDIVYIKGDIPTIREYQKLNTYNSIKVNKGINKKQNECSLYNAGGYEHGGRSKSSVHYRRNSQLGKRKFDKIYYRNTLRNSTIADFKFLRDVTKEKAVLICVLLSFHAISGILLNFLIPIEQKSNGIFEITKLWYYGAIVGFSIFTFIVILSFIYLFRSIAKYIKIINKKREIHNTAYPSISKIFHNSYNI
ncbi:Plasmodium exported protein, unknown function [Plasmodium malariae]|uniref:Fam-m protein n=1 Tax=Plasmodium malariae TaxID=5858 RepID=A0A1D3JM11_PLAMA|nr:Plasmodium exported protein, unknown function [Plasmodium malariae]SBT87656.1 Plasmodium exported protein, unknown function [Plasmodium malariae]